MRVLLTGVSGQFGPYVTAALRARGEEVIAWSGSADVDLTDHDAIGRAFEAARPDAVIHAAAISKPATALADPQRARRVNVEATEQLVELAVRRTCRFVFLSTDMVFDGEKGTYTESDAPNPQSAYGQTKLEAETPVLVAEGLVVRLSLLFGPSRTRGIRTFLNQQIDALRSGKRLRVFEDEWRTPLAMDVAADALAEAIDAGISGLYHLGGPQRMNRAQFAQVLARVLGADESLLERCSRLTIESDEPRPRDTSLDSSKWLLRFPHVHECSIEQSLRRMV